MLVIHRSGGGGGAYHGGMGRYYHGSGMIADIGRKLFSSGIKKTLNSDTVSAIAHKVVDAVVNGAASETSKKVANAIAKEVVSVAGKASANAVFDSLANKKKRLANNAYTTVPLKRKKIDIDSLIDGSGILYD